MKKRTMIPIMIILVALLCALYYFLTVPKIVVRDIEPKNKYTYLSTNDVLENIDEEASRYDSVEIFIDNNGEWISFDEYNKLIRSQHETIEFDQEGLPLFGDIRIQLRIKSSVFNDTADVDLKVIDTSAPTLTILHDGEEVIPDSSVTLLEGIKLEDVITTRAQDDYFGNSREVEVTSNVDLSTPLKYGDDLSVLFEAKDDDGNTTTLTLNVEVEKKPVAVVPEPPVSQVPNSPEAVKPPAQTNNDLAKGDLNRVDVLVNKKNALPSDFVPNLVTFPDAYAVSDGYRGTKQTVDAFVALVDAMKSETDLWMYVTSSYRSYQFQSELYNSYVRNNGQAEADRFSAKPGKSEHQTGLAIDLVTPGGSMWDFASTPQSDWLKVNAHKYGFILRYLEGKEHITGYMYEAWHIRYLGIDLATEVYNSGLTYEEYLGVE